MTTNEFYSEATQGLIEHFPLGDFELSSGFTLPDADLAYKTHGTLNVARDNAILLLNAYSATATFMDAFVGPGRPLDPEKYFIIQPSQLGSGLGSSPSTTPPPFDGPAFPAMNVADDVRAQKRLIDHFDITTLRLVSGYSMGGQQTFEWAARYPNIVERALPIAATATTPEHNRIYLDLIRTLLTSDPAFQDGHYSEPHAVHVGLRRHAQATALMGLTAQAFREESWRSLGFHSRDDFIRGFVEAYFLPMDPNNLLSQMAKWVCQISCVTGIRLVDF